MALNDPRTIPYAFRVVELDGWVWLYDDSSRTYICSPTPTIFMEPLYPCPVPPAGEEWTDEQYERAHSDAYDSVPEADYWGADTIERLESIAIDNLDPDDTAPDTDEKTAWDAAREEANANCRI